MSAHLTGIAPWLQPFGCRTGRFRLMLRISVGSCIFSFALLCESNGQDLSARLGALTHDVTAPYADDKYVPDPKNRSAYEKARQILQNEHLLNAGRPVIGPAPKLADAYGKALALGASTSRLLPEIAELHGIAVSGDRQGMRQQIQKIYEKLGRTVPSDDAMDNLVDAVSDASLSQGKANEEFSVTKPDYEVDTKYSPATGKVTTEVTGKDNDNPFRAVFDGDLQASPAANGKDLDLSAKPAEQPRIVDAKESERLAPLITGDWTDNENNPWTIDLNGSSITMTTVITVIKQQHSVEHSVVYTGKYALGAISAQHNVDSPDDIKDNLPDPVKGELASSYHPPYIVKLEVPQEADKLTGTWTSRLVTYSSQDMKVSGPPHDPWDKPLVLTRNIWRLSSGAGEKDTP